MKADEDEDDDTTIGSGHYPCLPSLVALQQMRNRLHMAHNGKRLMKWSAMATGRELRKIAMEIQQVFKGFDEDMKNAYILLARCRYYYSTLNAMTTENVGSQAVVTVDRSSKCVTGVRILQYAIVESGAEPLPCLGIDHGGTCIREAKIAWLELLRRLIKILELRMTFTLIELSNKSATKKANVLGKIIVPRTEMTIRYILSQLEEMEREEFFRLKKVLEVKYRHKKKKQQEPECPLCIAEKEAAAKKKEKREEKKVKENCIICKGPMKSDSDKAAKDEAKKADIQEQLDKIISITKQYDKMGIKSSTVDDFKVMAEQLKKKLTSKEFAPIPKDVDVNKLCDACKKRSKMQAPSISFSVDKPDETGDVLCKICDKGSEGGGSTHDRTCGQRSPVSSLKESHSKGRAPSPVSFGQTSNKPSPVSLSQTPYKPSPTPSQSQTKPSQVSAKKPADKPQKAVCEKHEDLELGVFETDVKEIVKIIRRRNADGTLTEEKVVINIKKETRNPTGQEEEQNTSLNIEEESTTSSCSKSDNPYDSKRTVGLITIPNTKKQHCDVVIREVNSCSQLSPSFIEAARNSISSSSVMSIDSEFEAWLENTKKSTDTASSNEGLNPDETIIGVAVTVNPKFPVIPREVQSYDSAVVSTTIHPIARNCKSSSSLILIDNFNYKIDENNKTETAKFCTTLTSNRTQENEKTGDPKEKNEKRESQPNYFPLYIKKSRNLDKCAPLSNITAIAKRTGKPKFIEFTNMAPMLTGKNVLSNHSLGILKENNMAKDKDIKLESNKTEMEQFNLCKLTTCKHFTEPKKVKDNNILLKDKKCKIDESFPEVVEKEIDYLPLEYLYEETKGQRFLPFHRSVVTNMKSARSDLGLGVIETSLQEVVQIVRTRNKDGTLTEDRRVVQIKREIRYPVGNNDSNDTLVDTINEKMYVNSPRASIESNRYVDSKTVGMVSTYDPEKWRAIGREVKSYYAPIYSQKDELLRYCVSSTSMITVDYEFEAVCKCLMSNSDQKENIASDLREYVTSSTEFEILIDSFVPNEYTEGASTSGYSKKCVCKSTSNSDQNIDLDSVQENQRTSE